MACSLRLCCPDKLNPCNWDRVAQVIQVQQDSVVGQLRHAIAAAAKAEGPASLASSQADTLYSPPIGFSLHTSIWDRGVALLTPYAFLCASPGYCGGGGEPDLGVEDTLSESANSAPLPKGFCASSNSCAERRCCLMSGMSRLLEFFEPFLPPFFAAGTSSIP